MNQLRKAKSRRHAVLPRKYIKVVVTYVLLFAIVFSNMSNPLLNVFAGQKKEEFRIHADELQRAAEEALEEGNIVEEPLDFYTKDSSLLKEYEELFAADGTLYEIFPDYEREYYLDDIELRIFLRISPDADPDSYALTGEETLIFLSKDKQSIYHWRFYAGQEHTLGADWGLNYGVAYTTALDNSYQMYYDPETEALLPDNNMQSRRREQTLNFYAGLSKSFGEKLSADVSLAAEQYHTDMWNEWSLYPVANLTYLPAPGHILQFSLSSDKEYPEYWSMQNSTSYMGAYSEIQGNPFLKPATNYEANISYILKGKYVLTAYYSRTKNKEMQTLYQSPERLVEIYKCFNFDFSEQAGLVMVVPFKVKKWLDSRITAIGFRYRQKDSDFWDIPFDRKLYTFVLTKNKTFNISTKPDLKFTLSGFYQNKAIQGIFDLPRSGNLDAALRYTFAKGKAQLTLKCDDIFNTSTISTNVRFGQQNVKNHYMKTTRAFGISFNYKFGGYKEKKREEVDTSRFK